MFDFKSLLSLSVASVTIHINLYITFCVLYVTIAFLKCHLDFAKPLEKSQTSGAAIFVVFGIQFNSLL